MSKRQRVIMGAALGVAAIAIAIDHTRHRLPEPVTQQDAGLPSQDQSPLSPCSLGDAPPCSLGGKKSPCSL